MKKSITCIAIILIYALATGVNLAQAQEQSKGVNLNGQSETGNIQFQFEHLLAQARARPRRPAGFSLMPAGISAAASRPAFFLTPIVTGPNLQVFGGGTTGRLTKWTGFTSSTSFIGDSNIYEDKFGKVGIGTTTPTSTLTVQGMIETTLEGIKFPDGTLQTTSAAGSLFAVTHDATLQGAGTPAAPLGVAVPLILNGSVSNPNAIIWATNATGMAIRGIGGAGVGILLGVPVGVIGESSTGVGVFGESKTGDGVQGFSDGSNGVLGISPIGNGVRGDGHVGVFGLGINSTIDVGGTGVAARGGNSDVDNAGDAVFAVGGQGSGAGHRGGNGISAFGGLGNNGATRGRAGTFDGDVDVQGKLTKTMGTFKIDHPLDPENKYLYHSFVESPDMMNIYNGNITTDQNGDAVVEMPDYFDALNKDFRYQLTVIGTFAQAIVASEMKDNRFVIKTNAPGVKVSWMVTGIRQDAYANKNRVQVEEDKPDKERGYYLHPEVFNQPDEKSIQWARHPEMMQQMKESRSKHMEESKQKAQDKDR